MVNYDMTMSDLMMKIGRQMWLVILLILVLWSGEEGPFPASNVRKLISGSFTAPLLPPLPALPSASVSGSK